MPSPNVPHGTDWSEPSWTAQDLADAIARIEPLRTFAFAPSANDVRLHRPRRGASFLPTASAPVPFRIGG